MHDEDIVPRDFRVRDSRTRSGIRAPNRSRRLRAGFARRRCQRDGLRTGGSIAALTTVLATTIAASNHAGRRVTPRRGGARAVIRRR